MLLIDATGRIIFANSGAAALFSRDRDALSDMTFGELFAPESRRAALDYLDRLNRDATAGIINPVGATVVRYPWADVNGDLFVQRNELDLTRLIASSAN